MNLNEYLASDGAQKAAQIARVVGVSPAMVYQWRMGLRPVPAERCAAVERATGGAVTRKDLRPNDWQTVWPELAA